MSAESLQLAEHHSGVGHQNRDDDGNEAAQKTLEDKGEQSGRMEKRRPGFVEHIEQIIPVDIPGKTDGNKHRQEKGQHTHQAAGNGPKHGRQHFAG